MTSRSRTRTRLHAVAPLGSILLVATAVLAFAAPVAAKEGMQAELTTKIPKDPTPGSTLAVAWDAFMPSESGGRNAIFGSPIFIRFVAASDTDTSTEVTGHEQPSGSGHYVAEITVPKSGVREVQLGLRGEMCENGTCRRDDLLLRIVGSVFVKSTDPTAAKVVGPVAAPSAAPVAPAASVAVATAAPPVTTPVTPAAPVATSSGIEPVWLAGIAAAIVAAVAGLTLVARRRGSSRTPLTPGTTHS